MQGLRQQLRAGMDQLEEDVESVRYQFAAVRLPRVARGQHQHAFALDCAA